ncbi:MAG: cyclic nucleotide-binding domain-containing protein [Acidimicrobiia bacterium]
MPGARIGDVLRATSLFAGLSEEQISRVEGHLKTQKFLPGETVVREGSSDETGMWIVLEGEAEVRKGGAAVHIFRPGDFFGELALLSEPPTPRSADVKALGRLSAAELRRDDLLELLNDAPGVALAMLTELARRLRHTTERLQQQQPDVSEGVSLEDDELFGSIARGLITPPISRFGPKDE